MTDGLPLGHRHPDVRRLRELLRDPAARRADGRFVLEGPRLVADAVARSFGLDAVYLGDRSRGAFGGLIADLDAAGVPVHDLREGVLEKLGTTRTPQPVLGVARIPAPVALDELAPGLVLVTSGVSDPGNLGSIVRSAEAAGAVAVVVIGGVDPWNPKVVRASAGSVLGIPVLAADPDDLGAFAARGWRVIGIDAAATVRYDEYDLRGAVAIVVGHESHGIDPALASRMEGTVVIPMAGPTESLNAAVAASVVLFEAARQHRG